VLLIKFNRQNYSLNFRNTDFFLKKDFILYISDINLCFKISYSFKIKIHVILQYINITKYEFGILMLSKYLLQNCYEK